MFNDTPTLNSAPVDLNKVAKAFGIIVISKALDTESAGFATPHGNGWTITLNSNLSEHRQRFTLAQLIGHCIFHNRELRAYDGMNLNVKVKTHHGAGKFNPMITDRHLKEATDFALQTLMPQKLIEDEVSSMFGMNEASLYEALAEKFNIAAQLIKLRLNRLAHQKEAARQFEMA